MNNTGAAYEAYKNFWNRDSYDHTPARRSSAASTTRRTTATRTGMAPRWCTATRRLGLQAARALGRRDAHELTHAVTERESGLVYSGESGGINESFSDIFGAFVEAWVDGGKTGTLTVSSDTFLVGEDILPPALRYMCDPAADGASKESVDQLGRHRDVHYSSGVGNLAFCLLAKGGTHAARQDHRQRPRDRHGEATSASSTRRRPTS